MERRHFHESIEEEDARTAGEESFRDEAWNEEPSSNLLFEDITDISNTELAAAAYNAELNYAYGLFMGRLIELYGYDAVERGREWLERIIRTDPMDSPWRVYLECKDELEQFIDLACDEPLENDW